MARISASTARIRREHKRRENRRKRQQKTKPDIMLKIKQPKPTTSIQVSAKGMNLARARYAKKQKVSRKKVGAAKRTKVAQQLKKRGITSDIGISGLTVERTIKIDKEVRRGIGQPTKLDRRDKLGRFQKTKETIEVISRRSDPAFRIDVKLPKLDRSIPSSGNVASSWIAYLEWNPNNNTVTMGLLDGMNYVYNMTFEEYTGWFYALSKGTYWWVKLRSKYNNRYINKYKL